MPKKPGSVWEDEPRNRQAVALDARIRNPFCRLCPMHANSKDGDACMIGNGPVPADGMVIYDQPFYWDFDQKRPLLGDAGAYFDNVLDEAGLSRDRLYITAAVKCRPSSRDTKDAKADAQRSCGVYLDQEIAAVQPKVILSMGANPYYYFTHKPGGVMAARGEATRGRDVKGADGELYQPWVITTLGLAQVLQSPAFNGTFSADVVKFGRYLRGQIEAPPVQTPEIHTIAEFNATIRELWSDPDVVLSYDLETKGFVVYKPDAKVWCMGVTRTNIFRRDNPETDVVAYMLPLEHPDSPFIDAEGRCDPRVVRECLRLIFRNKVNGHNLLFDLLHATYLAERYGIDLDTLTAEPEWIPEEGYEHRTERPLLYGRPDPALIPVKEPKAKKPRTSKPVKPRKPGRGAGDDLGAGETGTEAVGDAGDPGAESKSAAEPADGSAADADAGGDNGPMADAGDGLRSEPPADDPADHPDRVECQRVLGGDDRALPDAVGTAVAG